MGAMSWAPFYHPSGQYLIFTTNRHGFANFELYLVDIDGKSPPVRVTYTKGFDGLPAFTPDGSELAWTSNRTASGQSQLFLANWNHEKARELLGLDLAVANDLARVANSDQSKSNAEEAKAATHASSFAQFAHERATPDYAAADIGRHVKYLCHDDLAGRLYGLAGRAHGDGVCRRLFRKAGTNAGRRRWRLVSRIRIHLWSRSWPWQRADGK